MSEEWRPVPDWEGIYEASNYGHVRSLARSVRAPQGGTQTAPGRLLRPTPGAGGHLYVSLSRGGQVTKEYVHTLVLLTFVGPRPTPKHEACHGNGRPEDNAVANLRWGTNSENHYDAVRHGTHPAARRTHCPLEHELVAPNLTAASVSRGHRTCLACHRAHDYLRWHPTADLRVEADRRYSLIMGR